MLKADIITAPVDLKLLKSTLNAIITTGYTIVQVIIIPGSEVCHIITTHDAKTHPAKECASDHRYD